MSGAVIQIAVMDLTNVFLLRGEGGFVLMDTGNPGQADLILERLGGGHFGFTQCRRRRAR